MNVKVFYDHGYILMTIFFSVVSQSLIKWRMSRVTVPDKTIVEKFYFLLGLLADPWMFISILFTFFSGLCWMMVVNKFAISYAYSFISLNFVLMALIGVFIFKEQIVFFQWVGILLVMVGVYFLSLSKGAG